jgi:AcrR family transcriptional regulator
MSSMEVSEGNRPRPPHRVRRIPNFRLSTKPSRLLPAALEVFSTTSFQEARVDQISSKLGLTKTVIYEHFSSKRELFDRVIDEYCLPDDLEIDPPEASLTQVFGSFPAHKVLKIVLREWCELPGIGNQYLAAVTAKLSSKLRKLDADTARQLAISALAPLVMEMLLAVEARNDQTFSTTASQPLDTRPEGRLR